MCHVEREDGVGRAASTVELADVDAVEFVLRRAAPDGDAETVVTVDPHGRRSRRQIEVSENFGRRVVCEGGRRVQSRHLIVGSKIPVTSANFIQVQHGADFKSDRRGDWIGRSSGSKRDSLRGRIANIVSFQTRKLGFCDSQRVRLSRRHLMKIPDEPGLGCVPGAGGERIRARNRGLRFRSHADQTRDCQRQSKCAAGPSEKLHDGIHSFGDCPFN